jgi:hypothetical protein
MDENRWRTLVVALLVAVVVQLAALTVATLLDATALASSGAGSTTDATVLLLGAVTSLAVGGSLFVAFVGVRVVWLAGDDRPLGVAQVGEAGEE